MISLYGDFILTIHICDKLLTCFLFQRKRLNGVLKVVSLDEASSRQMCQNQLLTCRMVKTLAPCRHVAKSSIVGKMVKVRSCIAQYPARMTAQSALHFTPSRPVHSKAISTSLGSIQPRCNCVKTIRSHFHHCLYCQVRIYTAE